MKMPADGPWLNLSDGVCVCASHCVCSLTSRAEIKFKLVSLISKYDVPTINQFFLLLKARLFYIYVRSTRLS